MSATGIPAPTYQWLKNGTAIDGATGATLAIARRACRRRRDLLGDCLHACGQRDQRQCDADRESSPEHGGASVYRSGPRQRYTINVGVNLSVTNTATDADMPAETVAFSLLSGSGSVTAYGIFTWRPQVSDASTTNVVTIQVTDDGAPTMSATQSFSVIVNPLAQPDVSSPVWAGGQFSLSVNGQLGPDYAVQASTNLVNWQSVFTTNSPAMPFQWTDPDTGAFPLRFYRIVVGPPLP